MISNVFSIPTDDKKTFFCDKETGKWTIADKLDDSVIKYLSNTTTQRFNGTCMVVLNLGRVCNFGCLYCHIGSLKSQDLMSLKTGRKTIDRVLELEESDRHVVFHGSEPLANFALIRQLLEYAKEKKGDIRFSMQTNGSLLDEKKIKYLKDNHVGIGISLDGLKKHQDRTRPYSDGRSSYCDVERNTQEVRKEQGGISVISVITSQNVNDLEEIVEDFETRGINSVSFSLLNSSDRGVGLVPDLSVLSQKMINLFERYLNHLKQSKKTIKIRNLRDIVRTFFSTKVTANCVKCGGNGKHPLIGIDFDGLIYPCDFFWGRKDYSMGNIFENSFSECFDSEKNVRVYRDINQIAECNPCDWKMFCGGGCVGESAIKGDLYSKTEYCDFWKEILPFIARNILGMHKSGIIREILS